MTEVEQKIIESLQRQEELLKQLINSINKPVLGLHNDANVVYIYCNRSNGCLWYTLDSNRNPQPINETALTGYLRKLKFEKVERRGKECYKLVAIIEADRMYHLEAGHNSHFAKGFLMAIASLSPQHLQNPITIEPQPGNDETVLFCRIWFGNQVVKAPYGEGTDWHAIAKRAMNNVIEPEK